MVVAFGNTHHLADAIRPNNVSVPPNDMFPRHVPPLKRPFNFPLFTVTESHDVESAIESIFVAVADIIRLGINNPALVIVDFIPFVNVRVAVPGVIDVIFDEFQSPFNVHDDDPIYIRCVEPAAARVNELHATAEDPQFVDVDPEPLPA
jgi:hypothetical protein